MSWIGRLLGQGPEPDLLAWMDLQERVNAELFVQVKVLESLLVEALVEGEEPICYTCGDEIEGEPFICERCGSMNSSCPDCYCTCKWDDDHPEYL